MIDWRLGNTGPARTGTSCPASARTTRTNSGPPHKRTMLESIKGPLPLLPSFLPLLPHFPSTHTSVLIPSPSLTSPLTPPHLPPSPPPPQLAIGQACPGQVISPDRQYTSFRHIRRVASPGARCWLCAVSFGRARRADNSPARSDAAQTIARLGPAA